MAKYIGIISTFYNYHTVRAGMFLLLVITMFMLNYYDGIMSAFYGEQCQQADTRQCDVAQMHTPKS